MADAPGIPVGANIDTVAAIVTGVFTKRACAALITGIAFLNGHLTRKWYVLYCTVFVIAAALSTYQRRQTKIDWSQQRVLLTGGSHGIGLSLLARLIAAGTRNIAVIDIVDIPMDHLPDSVKLYRCDLSSAAQLGTTLDAIREEVGDITVLVSNAGTLCPHLLCDMSAADIDRVMGVNLLAPIHIARRLLPSMLQLPHAHLLFVSSVLGFAPAPQLSTYVTSKAGLTAFQESLKLELRHRLEGHNVHVTCIYPSKVESGLFDGLHLPQWFSPALSPDLVAHRIFTQLESGCGAEIHLPLCARLMPLYMLAPDFCRTLVGKLFGSLNAMCSYRGYTHPDGTDPKL
ncbi:hypothetical protein EV175_002922 [Coemansia sp. RSA 1933]|nr:hypothetical protein EV175_002922 [Coemansia sp. RSA 1933]